MKARRPLVRCLQARLARATALGQYARRLSFAQRRRLALAWRRAPRVQAVGAAHAAVAVRYDTRIACRIDWRPMHAHVTAATTPTRVRTVVEHTRERARLANGSDAIASRRVVGKPDPRATVMALPVAIADVARIAGGRARASMCIAKVPVSTSRRLAAVEAPPTLPRIGHGVHDARPLQPGVQRASREVAMAFALVAPVARMVQAVGTPRVQIARPRPRPTELTWATTRPADHDAQAAGGPASPFARASSRASATPVALPTAAVARAAAAEALRQAGAAPIGLDRAATDRIADEVMRRVDKQLRIERERRGR